MSGEDPIIAGAMARNAAKEAATKATLARVNIENISPETLKEIARYAHASGVTRSDPLLLGLISASYDVGEVRTEFVNGELAGLSHEAQFTIGLLAGMKKEDIHITAGGGVKPIPRDKFSEGLEAALNLAENKGIAPGIFVAEAEKSSVSARLAKQASNPTALSVNVQEQTIECSRILRDHKARMEAQVNGESVTICAPGATPAIASVTSAQAIRP